MARLIRVLSDTTLARHMGHAVLFSSHLVAQHSQNLWPHPAGHALIFGPVGPKQTGPAMRSDARASQREERVDKAGQRIICGSGAAWKGTNGNTLAAHSWCCVHALCGL